MLEFIGGNFTDPGSNPAVSSFSYKLINGREQPNVLPDKIKEYLLSEVQNKYIFKLGVIAKKKGLFAIGIDNAASGFRKNDNCTKATFHIKLKDTDNQIGFYTQNRPGYTPSGLDLTNLYCFKVK